MDWSESIRQELACVPIPDSNACSTPSDHTHRSLRVTLCRVTPRHREPSAARTKKIVFGVPQSLHATKPCDIAFALDSPSFGLVFTCRPRVFKHSARRSKQVSAIAY